MTTAPSGMVLGPGTYLLELRTDPSVRVTAATLATVLAQAGFTDAVFDEGDVVPVPPGIGASPTGFALPKPTTAPSPATALRTAAASAAPLAMAAAMHMTPAPAPTTPGAASVARALASPAATSIARTQTTAAPAAVAVAKALAAQGKKGGLFQFAGPQGQGSGGGGGGDSGGDITFTPDPNDPRYANASDGSRYYLDPDTGVVYLVQKDGTLMSVDQSTLKPTGKTYPAPSPLTASSAAQGGGGGGGGGSDAGTADAGPVPTQQDLGGAPIDASTAALIAQGNDVEKVYGEDPAFSLTVGAASSGGDVHRVVARTDKAITIRPMPSLKWSARPLSVDPYVDSPLPLTTRPFVLNTGVEYECVVLSRDRKAKSRGDVWTLAEAMGFDPTAISLLARDLHLPRRPGSYSRWLLVGIWQGPATVTTPEEPLVFADVAAAR